MVVCVPFTGLGLYGGFRGNRWLRNRIKVFEQFVIPSLQAQTDQEFVLWVCWRREERTNPQVIQLYQRLFNMPRSFGVVFTYAGVPFWDDKYPDEVARERLLTTLRGSLREIIDLVTDCEEVYWLLQPSDDLYERHTIELVKKSFAKNPEIQAATYARGYLCNYATKQVLEYNPQTNPPFFAIRFPREVFFDPGRHATYTGPYKSHEYVGEKLRLGVFEDRGFLVGTHGENISTHFNHPYGGKEVHPEVLDLFGIRNVPMLTLPISYRKMLMRRLPYRVQRKLRYWFGEKLYARFYNWIRS